MALAAAKTTIKAAIKASINQNLKANYIALDSERYANLNDARYKKDFDNLCTAISKTISDSVVDGIIDGILASATITVTSVSGVTTGVGVSGPGVGTIT
jgi:hypothetical protein